jgi:nucleoside-diphosphate-sugar epimerase
MEMLRPEEPMSSEMKSPDDDLTKGGPAFIAGATGFTGREVVRLLVERGVPTFAHVRPDSPRLEEWRGRFSGLGAEVDRTAWERAAMTDALQRLRPAYVFALLGTTRARMSAATRSGQDPESQSYETVDYGLTVLLIQSAKEAGLSPRVVYLSAAGVKQGSRSAYFKARWKAETFLRSSGLPYTIARPSIITGPGRDDKRPLETMSAVVGDRLLSVAGLLGARKVRERYASTTNVRLAESLVRLALDPRAENRIFESEELYLQA